MSNPANPITIGTTATEILADPARRVALWLPADASANVTIVVTWEDGTTETTVVEAGGPGMVFQGKPPNRQISSITGTVASDSQSLYRAVLQP